MGPTVPGDLGHKMTPVIDNPGQDASKRIKHNTTPYIDNLGQDASARIAQNMTPPASQTPPQPSLTIIDLDSGGITFSDSFACGGWSRLTSGRIETDQVRDD
jgi:hypothetical protein